MGGFLQPFAYSIVKEICGSIEISDYGDNACPGHQPNSWGWDLGQDI